MGAGIERGRRDRPAEVADEQRLEARLGRDHRLEQEAGHCREAVGELVLGAEHHARADDRRGWKAGADHLLAQPLGAAIFGLRFGIGPDRADMDEGACSRRLGRCGQLARAMGMDQLEVPLERADQVDHRVRALDCPGDGFRPLEVGGNRRNLPDAAQRLQEPGLARMALGDAQPGAGLEQRLAHIAADEAAAAEHGDHWRRAGVPHDLPDPVVGIGLSLVQRAGPRKGCATGG